MFYLARILIQVLRFVKPLCQFWAEPYSEDSLLSNKSLVRLCRPKSRFGSDWDKVVASFNRSDVEAERSLPAGLANYNGKKTG